MRGLPYSAKYGIIITVVYNLTKTKMTKTTKGLLASLLVVVVGAGAFFLTSGEGLQGKLRLSNELSATRCPQFPNLLFHSKLSVGTYDTFIELHKAIKGGDIKCPVSIELDTGTDRVITVKCDMSEITTDYINDPQLGETYSIACKKILTKNKNKVNLLIQWDEYNNPYAIQYLDRQKDVMYQEKMFESFRVDEVNKKTNFL